MTSEADKASSSRTACTSGRCDFVTPPRRMVDSMINQQSSFLDLTTGLVIVVFAPCSMCRSRIVSEH